MLDFLTQNWEMILGFVLSIGLITLYLNKLRVLLRQVAELLIAFDNAFADSKLSREELEGIKKEALEVWDAVKAFAKK